VAKSKQIVKLPRPMRALWGVLGAYWLSTILHPAFVWVAGLFAVMMLILWWDQLFPPPPESGPRGSAFSEEG